MFIRRLFLIFLIVATISALVPTSIPAVDSSKLKHTPQARVTPEVAAAVDSMGRIHAVWVDANSPSSGNMTLWYSSYVPEVMHERTNYLLHSAHSIYSVGITIDRLEVHIVWVTRSRGVNETSNDANHLGTTHSVNEVHHAEVSSEGRISCSPGILLSSITESLWASIATANESELYLAWTQVLHTNSTNTESATYFARLRQEQNNSITGTMLARSDALSRMLRSTASPDRTNLYLTWIDEFAEDRSRVVYSHVDLAHNVSSTTNLEDVEGRVGRLNLAATPDGGVIVGWTYQEPTQSESIVRLTRVSPNANATALDIRLPRHLDVLESMTVDSQGNLHVVWVEVNEDVRAGPRPLRVTEPRLHYIRFNSEGEPSEEKRQAVNLPIVTAFVLENGDLYLVSPEGLLHVANQISTANPLILLLALVVIISVMSGMDTEVGTYHIAKLKVQVPWLKKRQSVNPWASIDAKLLRRIRGHPGITLSDLGSVGTRDLLQLASRLQMLERSGTICSQTDGTKRRFYCVASLNKKRLRVDELRQALFGLVDSHPGITEAQIARQLALRQQLANYHLKLLSEARILSAVRKDGKVSYFVNEWYRKHAT